MNGDEPYLPDLEIPDGMAPGSPRSGPIFTYTPWLSMGTAFLATMGINAALFARLHTGRGQHVETSMLQAALVMTAGKWQRAERNDEPGYRAWITDQRAPKGFFRCSDDRWIEQWVPNPKFVLSSADGDTLALRRDVDRVRDDPDRVPPDTGELDRPRALLPADGGSGRTVPERRVGSRRRRGRRSAPTGAHSRRGARRPRAAGRGRGRSTSSIPNTERSVRSASSTD